MHWNFLWNTAKTLYLPLFAHMDLPQFFFWMSSKGIQRNGRTSRWPFCSRASPGPMDLPLMTVVWRLARPHRTGQTHISHLPPERRWPSRRAWGWAIRTPWPCPPCPSTRAWTRTWWRSCGRTCCSPRDREATGDPRPPSRPDCPRETRHGCCDACCSTTTSTSKGGSPWRIHGER